MIRVEKHVQIGVRIKEVDSNFRSNMINLDKQDDKDKIPLREMLARVKALTFTLRLEIRNEDFEDEEFQLYRVHPNFTPT